jgi:flagellar biosynthesis component FlhA
MNTTKILLIGSIVVVFATLLWKLGYIEEPTAALVSAILTAASSLWAYFNDKSVQSEKEEDSSKKGRNSQKQSSKSNNNSISITNSPISVQTGNIDIVGGNKSSS